ncbi:NAD(P)/FAD-dependent oxidoreductase [Nonomuraea sp. NPDC005650]|uniref:FAD-dependent oxidoreductase n=1 Tax=Nonomuraea sp. NPDC005650 TaxID=3157045 RepID=UPI00339DAD43
MTSPRIAVVGAGLGGLTLARVLQVHGLPVTVLEREPSPDSRAQGGTLDMHVGSGQTALAKAGLLEEFRALARPEGQERRTLDEHGTLHHHEQPADGDESMPEIDRGQLRGLLIDSLADGTIRWGHGVEEVAGRSVRFGDGSGEEFDLVVGADGAWSRVRPSVSEARPAYTGVTFVETGFEEARHPELASLVGNGSMSAYGPDKAVLAQRNSNGRIRVYAAYRGPRDRPVPEVLAMFDGWAESVRALLLEADEPFETRSLFTLPVGHSWTHAPGVTLLGDAAHLMPPLGVGANLAMLEGAELADALAAALTTGPDVDAAVSAYESVMFPRAARLARFANDGLEALFSPKGVKGALRLFEELHR